MPKAVQVNVPGLGLVSGTEIPLIESVERWTELRLEDGSVLRVKPVVIGIMKIEGKYDPEGNPMYAVHAGHTMMVASVPDHLRQAQQTKLGGLKQ